MTLARGLFLRTTSPPWRLMLLGCFAVVILLGRLRLYPAPLHSDICAYALIGHEMRAGRPLYSDLWERKPPLLYLTFGAAERLVGYGRQEILLVNVLAAWTTLAGVYLAGQGNEKKAVGGLFAAGLWTLLCADLGLTANQPDPEVFISACLAMAVALLVYWSDRARRRRAVAIIGLGVLLSAATLYKHNAALVCGTLLIGHAVASVRQGKHAFWVATREATGAAVVIAAVWLGMLGHAYVAGRLPATVDVLFRQNFAYSGGSFGSNLLRGLAPAALFPQFMFWAIGPTALVIGFYWTGRFDRRRVRAAAGVSRSWIIWMFWCVGTWATVALTGHIYAHYYQLWLPVACVAGGWAAAGLWAAAGAPSRFRPGLVLVVFVGLAVRQGSQFLITPDQWVVRQFGYYSVAGQNAFGRQLGNFLRPDESFWELGEDNSLYFLSHHSPPSGLLFIDPLIYGPDTSRAWQRLMSDLGRRPPDLVVLSSDWLKFFPPDAPAFVWLRQNYDPYPTPIGWPVYRLYVRRDGQLQRRLPVALR